MQTTFPNAKKVAKLALLKLISRRVIPEGVTAKLLKTIGIDYERKTELEGKVFIPRFMNGCGGGFCISIDFDNRRDDRLEIDRRATLEILTLCEEFNIPVAWAVCGVTALREKDVFERILASKVKHEIAIHTFDHVDFSDPDCTEELARSQVLKTMSLLPHEEGRATFIFPWNNTGHFKVLEELGFIAYRGRETKLAYPSKNNGLWNIHPLLYLSKKNYTYSRMLKALLDLAISHEAVFHLWFHPWNLEVDGDVSRYIRDTLRPLFEYAWLKRRRKELWVCTLRDMANYCEARSCAKISHEENDRRMNINVECKIDDVRFREKPVLTLGVRMPKDIGKIRVSLDGFPVHDDELVFKKSGGKSEVLYLNLFFESPFKNVHINFHS
jgi:peptidoglycan/xylan/chitin deacetylase (PgdA/CDA1 family)